MLRKENNPRKPLLDQGRRPVERSREPGSTFGGEDQRIDERDRGDHQRLNKPADDACQHAEEQSPAIRPGQTPDLEEERNHPAAMKYESSSRRGEQFVISDSDTQRAAPGGKRGCPP